MSCATSAKRGSSAEAGGHQQQRQPDQDEQVDDDVAGRVRAWPQPAVEP
jgi:hypothetical protein